MEDLSGTILIALSIASFGLLCFLGSIIWNVVRRGLSPRDSEAEEASTSASTDGDKGPTQLKGNQSLAHLEAQPFEDRNCAHGARCGRKDAGSVWLFPLRDAVAAFKNPTIAKKRLQIQDGICKSWLKKPFNFKLRA